MADQRNQIVGVDDHAGTQAMIRRPLTAMRSARPAASAASTCGLASRRASSAAR
jgi:hypothetical protein